MTISRNTLIIPSLLLVFFSCLAASAQLQKAGADFYTVPPCPLLDTRTTAAPLISGVKRTFDVASRCDITDAAKGVALNVTVVSPNGRGHITLWPSKLEKPQMTVVNFSAGETRTNNVILGLPVDGLQDLAVEAFVNGGGSVHLIVNVSGYFASTFAPRPARVGEEILRVIETPHPYRLLKPVTRVTINHPGATYIAPHFERFDLHGLDFVVVRSPDGARFWRYRGSGPEGAGRRDGGFWAIPISGDTAIIELHRFGASKTYGYRIDKYARGLTSTEVVEVNKTEGTEAICGQDDWRNARCYLSSPPFVYNRAKPVARLLFKGVEHCTGWLFGSEGHILTNEHCLQPPVSAADISVELGAEDACNSNCRAPLACPGQIVAASTTLVRINAQLDYALLKPNTSANLVAVYGYLQARPNGAVIGEQIYIPQHPLGYGKQIAAVSTEDFSGIPELFDKGPANCGPRDLRYLADTEYGSSGSPVIAFSDHLVVALHHSRLTHCGPCFNGAVPIDEIVADLGANLPKCARSTDIGCPSAGLPTTNLPECASCAEDLNCTSPATCNFNKCVTPTHSRATGDFCCRDVQCRSGRCAPSGRCECLANTDCPAGMGCHQGQCLEAKREECEDCLFNFECAPLVCRGFPDRHCIKEDSKGLGQTCCVDKQCVSGSCAAGIKVCHCNDNSDCLSGYCKKGIPLLSNQCVSFKGECDGCTGSDQCAPGALCRLGKCATGGSLANGASCCRDYQCGSGKCGLKKGKRVCK